MNKMASVPAIKLLVGRRFALESRISVMLIKEDSASIPRIYERTACHC